MRVRAPSPAPSSFQGVSKMKVFNTLTGKKEEFIPLEKGKVRMYVCGPTVYDYSHIGHARSVIAFDIIRRYFEWVGYRVLYIQNFTDVDLKMINRANKEGITIYELADRFIKQYFQDFDALNVKRATFHPRATEHIIEMIKIIEGLIEKGIAYEVEGDVYFSVRKFSNYGKLSHKDLEEFQASEEEATIKNDPRDFALWKKRKANEPSWDSPWDQGRPGWHIECSAMSMKYLGESIDIHGGGRDLIFPHHENEIAQSEALTNKPFVKYFMHNGFVTINKGEKMSKSLGNFFTIKEILDKFPPMALRFFLISTHYRSPIDFNEDQINQAHQAYKRFQLALAFTSQAEAEGTVFEALSDELEDLIEKTRDGFVEAMDDDFSTPRAIASINNLVKYLNGLASKPESVKLELLKQAHDLLQELADVLGLVKGPKEVETDVLLNQLVKFIISLRKDARKQKQYEIADKIRDKLKELGITLLDSPTRTIWTKD